MRKLRALWVLLAVLCGDVSVAGNWVSSPPGSSAGLVERLDHARWISSGAKAPARVVYVFVDPDCPFCNELWKAMKAARAPDVQIRSLLVAVIDDDSRGRDAAILESSDPAATLDDHERRFDRGGIAPKSTVRPATSEIISANESLMRASHIFGTPGLVYRDESGEVKVFAGMPDSRQLRMIVGRR